MVVIIGLKFKNVHCFHNDTNYRGEAEFVANYQSNPLILNDSLVEPFFWWFAVPMLENLKDNST